MKKFFAVVISLASTVIVSAQVSDKIPGSNCDNIIRNTLPADAPNRTPTECEIQFDRNVRLAVLRAFRKVFDNFNEKDWVVSDTAFEALQDVGKQSGKLYLPVSYYFKIDMKPQSEMYKPLADGYQQLQNEMANPKADTYKKFTDFSYKVNNTIHVNFYITVNDVSDDITFKSEGRSQVFTMPGAVYAVKGTHAVGITEGTHDAAFIAVGKTKLSGQSKDEYGTGFRFAENFPKTGFSHLTVQSINIRIECNDELLNKILKEIDFKMLTDMIGH